MNYKKPIMKKFYIFPLLVVLMAALCGCSSKDEGNAAAPQATPRQKAAAASLNIRYIDGDSVTAHYNLAKDFKEASLRAFSKIESVRQSRGAEIQKFAAQIQEKARSNGYLSEASYNADMQKLQKMQEDAEAYLANMQRNTESDLTTQQLQLNDSVEKFVKEYNKAKGYDAILFKAAGVYFNPALDITDEIIEGLNARYNKVPGK